MRARIEEEGEAGKLDFSKRSEVYRCRRKKRKELVNNVYMNMRVKHGILGAYRI